MDRFDLEAREAAQAKAAALAADILAGRRGLVEAAHSLKGYLWHAGVADDDPALLAFVLIDSETDALPMGQERRYWDAVALSQKDADIARAEEWARPIGLPACEDVVQRFGHLTWRCS